MPKVTIKPTPGGPSGGRWALGIGMRQKFEKDGKTPVKDANGNPEYWPARSGRFFQDGESAELVITDEELKDLQSGANASFFAVVVTDANAQPEINEGGSSMAPQNQSGTTVPPGTGNQPSPPVPQGPSPTGQPPTPSTPSPTPTPPPTPTPAPSKTSKT